MQKIAFLFILLFAFAISADIHGIMPGGEPMMTFDDGGLDYFVMFNSLVDNTQTLYGETTENPQGDTCLNSSFFVLTDKHVPQDAIVEKAYLVWMGAVSPDKLDKPTDNEVTLSFDNEEGDYPVTHTATVKAGDTGKMLTDIPSFEFEGIKFEDDVFMGCNESEDGVQTKSEVGYFTYRVDVTDFVEDVQRKGRERKELSVDALYGKYMVSDLECTDHDNYKCSGNMVSTWSLIVVYRSARLGAKKLYLFTGLASVQDGISKAELSGFSLPSSPVIRQTVMVAQGKSGSTVNAEMLKEELLLQRKGVATPYNIQNKCNPQNGDNYEIYNTNSSIMHWNSNPAAEDFITCVTAGVAEQKYGIDVDTFLIDTSRDIELIEHLAQGDAKIDFTISVNENKVLTNFMMFSVDTKKSRWDITWDYNSWVPSTEKRFCACSSTEKPAENYYCYARPFYYLIYVENWGDDIAKDVWISDDLIDMDYIPGTAEIGSYVDGRTRDWKRIEDNDGFPLRGKGYKVADEIAPCNSDSQICPTGYAVRFLVKPLGLTPFEILKNTAVITDASGAAYKTNSGWPTPLSPIDCVGLESCYIPSKKECGGLGGVCRSKDDCEEYYRCLDGFCIERDIPSSNEMCTTSVGYKYSMGEASPTTTFTHIVPRDNSGELLVVGQILLNASRCDDRDNFLFTELFISLSKDDESITFSEQQLIYDVDGDGVYKKDSDRIVRIAQENTLGGFRFLLNDSVAAYSGDTDHNFLIMTKIAYDKETIPENTTFNCLIASPEHLQGENRDGDIQFKKYPIDYDPVTFAKFMLEPSGDYFFGEVGSENPVPPEDKSKWNGDENGEIPVMKFWMKSGEIANEITDLVVGITEDSNNRFGRDIASVSLYLDSDEDGEGDTLVKRVTKFKDNKVHFTDFDSPLLYDSGERKTFVLTAAMDYMDENEDRAVFLINEEDVVLKKQSKILGFPLVSETFHCDEWGNCPSEEDVRFCLCTVVTVEKGSKIYAFLLFLLIFPLFGLFVRKKQ